MPTIKELRGVLSDAERHAQMQMAIDTGFPFIEKVRRFHEDTAQIVCYGPSLLDTWHRISQRDRIHHPIITVSGAHDFLWDRGIWPSIHVEIDPRPHKPKMLRHPQYGTRYLMASVCHPDFWPKLKDKDVTLWHLINGPETVQWIMLNHLAGRDAMIGGHSTVGQRALNVAAALGFRKFQIFGMDCSFKIERHAGAHTGEDEPTFFSYSNGRPFRTTPQLFQAAREMREFLLTTDAEVEFYGDGLMQTIAETIRKEKR